MNQNTIIATLLIAGLVTLGIMQHNKNRVKIREPYQNMFSAKDYGKGNWVSRPDFKADLDPRFDSTRNAGNIRGSFPGMEVQGAPLSPVESVMSVSTPDFATMGGGPNAAYGDPRLPSGGLTTSQVNNIIAEKFGRGAGNSGNYTQPKDLLPVPDMKAALAKDPSDPNTYMYDRYLFAPLKRRYGNVNVDFIRGDLAIPQLRMGWFDPSPVASQDLMAGYFSDYLDIQQSTSIKDSVFQRSTGPIQEDTAFGRLGEETIYSLL